LGLLLNYKVEGIRSAENVHVALKGLQLSTGMVAEHGLLYDLLKLVVQSRCRGMTFRKQWGRSKGIGVEGTLFHYVDLNQA